MADLEKHARRLDSKIQELNTELKKTQDKLSEVVRDKQDRLLKSALAPQGNATGSIDRINQEIAFLKQKIEDVGFVKGKLVEELLSVAEKIKEERLGEQESRVAQLEAEKKKIDKKIHEHSEAIQRLINRIHREMLDGVLLPAPPEGYLNDQIIDAQNEIGQIKELKVENILGELGIELEEEKEEAIPSIFWQCGSCGLKKAFVTENEQATFQTRHYEGECEAQKIAEKRAKREEVLR